MEEEEEEEGERRSGHEGQRGRTVGWAVPARRAPMSTPSWAANAVEESRPDGEGGGGMSFTQEGRRRDGARGATDDASHGQQRPFDDKADEQDEAGDGIVHKVHLPARERVRVGCRKGWSHTTWVSCPPVRYQAMYLSTPSQSVINKVQRGKVLHDVGPLGHRPCDSSSRPNPGQKARGTARLCV